MNFKEGQTPYGKSSDEWRRRAALTPPSPAPGETVPVGSNIYGPGNISHFNFAPKLRTKRK